MAWVTQGSLRGPKGDTGDVGPAGPKGDTGEAGAQGIQGVQGVQGVPGSNGQDGAGVSIAGEVATYANLPNDLTNTNTDKGKGYLVQADGKLYVWTGLAFPSDGNGVDFRGPQGTQGIQGIQGIQGVQGNVGPAGNDGAAGATGATGPRGSMWFTGSGAPSGVGGAIAGDMYLDTLTGTIYQLS